MTLLTPWAGFFLLAGVVPPLLVLYFLKLRRRTMPVSSTLLWLSSTADLQANTPFQRLRRNILLLLQLIILLLLILAIMQPRLEGRQGAGGRTVLLIDRSGSMTARDAENGSRLEEAKARAREAIDRLHPGGLFSSGDGETMIVTFGEQADILQPFTDSRSQLLAAVDRIEASHGGSRIGEALQLARVYSTNTDPDNPDAPQILPAHLELFSDGMIEDIDDQVLRGETITYHRIGQDEPANYGVLQLAADRPWDAPGDLVVFASLGNFSSEEVEVDVQLTIDGVARSVQEVKLPPAQLKNGKSVPGRRNLAFSPFELTRGAVIEVLMLANDVMVADDSAVMIVPPPRELRVALVTDGRILLERLLSGFSLEELRVFSPASWKLEGLKGGWDIVVFDNTTPDTMPTMPTLTLGGIPPVEELRGYSNDKTGQVALQAAMDHPVMRYVNIDTLFVQESEAIQPGDEVEVLLEGSQTPLIFGWDDQGVPRVHVAFDPIKSTWPYESGFVAFLYNAIDWLGHRDAALVEQQRRPGGSLAFDLNQAGIEADLICPDGSRVGVQAHADGRVVWGPVELAGLHVLETGGPEGQIRIQQRSVLFPADSESNLMTRSSVQLGQDQIEAVTEATRGYVPIWPWAIGVSLLILMVEWWVWSSRVGGGVKPVLPGVSVPNQ
ncbi:MAG: hypothetical protein CMJ39_02470 [Phycisphaerae bacterium]|nr:hypothetical protein [Phycisphaerae bacterium]